MINFRLLRLSDSWLWLSSAALLVIGLLAIFSTTYGLQIRLDGDPLIFVKRQVIAMLIGFLGLAFFAYFDYHYLKKLSIYFYLFMVLMLGLTLISGSSAQGAQRWVHLGLFSFQPSEISKLIMIVALAAFFDQCKKIVNINDAMMLLIISLIPFALIFKQPDLGTALVYLIILVGMLAYVGASPRLLMIIVTPVFSIIFRPILVLWLIYLTLLALILFLKRANWVDWLMVFGVNVSVGLAFPVIWGMLKLYQRQRILTFLNPAADPYGAGYHSLQSMIAIGSGGLFGKGFLGGSQTQLQFIPEQHSDFIFSAIGEEFGFLGSLVVLALFLTVIWRALAISFSARDAFGSYVAAGIATMLSFHVLANVGMAIGILPVVGIPLPLISFGGSSLFMNLVCLGILQNISMRQQKLIF